MAKTMKSSGNVADDPHDCNCGRNAKVCPWAVTPPMSRGERVPTSMCPELLKHPQTLPPAVTKEFKRGKPLQY